MVPNVNVQDLNGFSCLKRAISNKDPNLIKVLLMNGAKLNLKDNNGNTEMESVLQMKKLKAFQLVVFHCTNFNF